MAYTSPNFHNRDSTYSTPGTCCRPSNDAPEMEMVWLYNETKDRFMTPMAHAGEGFVCPSCATYSLDTREPKVKTPCGCIWHKECLNRSICKYTGDIFTCPTADCGTSYPELRYMLEPVGVRPDEYFSVPGSYPGESDFDCTEPSTADEELLTYEEYYGASEPSYKTPDSPELPRAGVAEYFEDVDLGPPETVSKFPGSLELPPAHEDEGEFQDVDVGDDLHDEEAYDRSIYSEVMEYMEDKNHERSIDDEPWEFVDRSLEG